MKVLKGIGIGLILVAATPLFVLIALLPTHPDVKVSNKDEWFDKPEVL